jgi:hypothetical protein
MRSLRFARVLLLSGAVSGTACGLPSSVPIPTEPTPPPAIADAPDAPPSRAVLEIVDVAVPLPRPWAQWLMYLPTFTVHEIGGLAGAVIDEVDFLDAEGLTALTVHRSPSVVWRVEPSGTWEFTNPYFDVDFVEPLAALSVRVHFVGDDQRSGVVSSDTWTAPSAP